MLAITRFAMVLLSSDKRRKVLHQIREQSGPVIRKKSDDMVDVSGWPGTWNPQGLKMYLSYNDHHDVAHYRREDKTLLDVLYVMNLMSPKNTDPGQTVHCGRYDGWSFPAMAFGAATIEWDKTNTAAADDTPRPPASPCKTWCTGL